MLLVVRKGCAVTGAAIRGYRGNIERKREFVAQSYRIRQFSRGGGLEPDEISRKMRNERKHSKKNQKMSKNIHFQVTFSPISPSILDGLTWNLSQWISTVILRPKSSSCGKSEYCVPLGCTYLYRPVVVKISNLTRIKSSRIICEWRVLTNSNA